MLFLISYNYIVCVLNREEVSSVLAPLQLPLQNPTNLLSWQSDLGMNPSPQALQVFQQGSQLHHKFLHPRTELLLASYRQMVLFICHTSFIMLYFICNKYTLFPHRKLQVLAVYIFLTYKFYKAQNSLVVVTCLHSFILCWFKIFSVRTVQTLYNFSFFRTFLLFFVEISKIFNLQRFCNIFALPYIYIVSVQAPTAYLLPQK